MTDFLQSPWGLVAAYLGSFVLALLAVELRLTYGAVRLRRKLRQHEAGMLDRLEREAHQRRAQWAGQAALTAKAVADYKARHEKTEIVEVGELTPVWPSDAVIQLRKDFERETPKEEG